MGSHIGKTCGQRAGLCVLYPAGQATSQVCFQLGISERFPGNVLRAGQQVHPSDRPSRAILARAGIVAFDVATTSASSSITTTTGILGGVRSVRLPAIHSNKAAAPDASRAAGCAKWGRP